MTRLAANSSAALSVGVRIRRTRTGFRWSGVTEQRELMRREMSSAVGRRNTIRRCEAYARGLVRSRDQRSGDVNSGERHDVRCS